MPPLARRTVCLERQVRLRHRLLPERRHGPNIARLPIRSGMLPARLGYFRLVGLSSYHLLLQALW